MSGQQSKICCLGMTLVELMVVIAILSIVLGIAVLNLKSSKFKLKSATYNLRTHLLRAKSEAVKRNASVTVNFDSSTESYNATVSGGLLFSFQLGDNIDLSTNNTSVSFTPIGTATNANIGLSSYGGSCSVRVTSSGRIYINGSCP